MNDFDIRRINLNLLPALEALLREGSVSGAARKLNVTQSAMSHALGRLRAVLQDPLLVPSGRGLTPTPRARSILAALPQALDRLGDAVQAGEGFDPRRSTRSFRIATLDYFELATLPELLSYWAAEAPGVQLQLERLGPTHFDELAQGTLDLVLAAAHLPVPLSIPRKVLYQDPFSVIARADHPAVGRRLTLAQYLALGHVLVSVEGRREGVVDRALAEKGLTRRILLRVPHFASAPLAVQNSDLICTVASTIAHRARQQGGIRILAPPLALPPTPVALFWPPSDTLDPAATWLRQIFLDGAAFAPRLQALMAQQRPGAPKGEE